MSLPLENVKWERFCQAIAKDGLTPTAAYVWAGYKKAAAYASASRMMKNIKVRTRIAELRGTIVSQVIKLEVTERNSRVRALQDIADRLRRVMDERGADPTMQAIPGGKTGLLVRQVKAGKTGDIEEYKVDTATTSEFRATLEQVAKEVGQWAEKRDLNVAWSGDMEMLTPAQRDKLMEQLAIAAFPGDPAALDKARQAAESEVVQ